MVFLDNSGSTQAASTVGIVCSTSAGGSFAGVRTGEILNVCDDGNSGRSVWRFRTFDGSAVAQRLEISGGGLFIPAAHDIYKDNSAYTNPHGGFEFAYTGKLDRYANRMAEMGITDYHGWTLSDLEAFTREHHHFPYFEDEAHNGGFSGGERHLLMTECLAVGVFDLAHRIEALEARIGRG
jgi:hypothetical protein